MSIRSFLALAVLVVAWGPAVAQPMRETLRGVGPPQPPVKPSAIGKPAGIVDVLTVAPRVRVRLKYAARRNVMGASVYGVARPCYLQEVAARKLARAQRALERLHPGWRLLMLDCLRPRSVQRRLWNLVAGTPRQPYVAHPERGSMHNYGAAVDITIVDEMGYPLDMGTAPDHFGTLAQPRLERQNLLAGRLTPEQVQNRELLRRVMQGAGWRSLSIEWWHFEAFSRREIRARFPILEEFPPL